MELLQPSARQHVSLADLWRRVSDALQRTHNMADGEGIRADDHTARQSCLVRSFADPFSHLVSVSFQLGTSFVACAVPLHPCASLHYRNVNVGPWSGFSMHLVEHFLYCSSLCIHWVVPSDPSLVIFHVIYLGLGAAMTHTGYEDLLIKDKRRLALGTFYHQLHHRYYEFNYGNQEMPWDRWFGTFHKGTSESTAEARARKKRMYS